MSDEDQLVQAGEAADKVRAFIESEVGQLILAAADQDEREAFKELLTIDPFEFTDLPTLQNTIAKIQENVMLSRKINSYLGDAIIRGDQADEILMSKEEGHND